MKRVISSGIARRSIAGASIILLTLFLVSCPNSILGELQEQLDVNFGLLGDTLTVLAGNGGSITTPPTSPLDIEYGVAIPIVAAPDGAHDFDTWSKVGGDGTVVFDSPGSASTNVTVGEAGVVIRASFSLKTYTLTATVNDGTKGSVSIPSGPVTVTHGVATRILASILRSPPTARGYYFSGWTQSGGTGSVEFLVASDHDTMATITGGDVEIQANFSPISATLVYKGTYNLIGSANQNERMETPRDFVYDSGYLYVAGNHNPGTGSEARVLKIDVSNPINPSFNAINTLDSGSQARTIIKQGTDLLVAAYGYGIRRIPISGFTTDFNYHGDPGINRLTYGGWYTAGEVIGKAHSHATLDLVDEAGIYIDEIYYDAEYQRLYVSGNDVGSGKYLAAVGFDPNSGPEGDIFLEHTPVAVVDDDIGNMVFHEGDIYLYAAARGDGLITYNIDDEPLYLENKDGLNIPNMGAQVIDIDNYGNYLVTAGVNSSTSDRLAIWDVHLNNGSNRDPYFLSTRNSRSTTNDIKAIDMFDQFLYTLEGTDLVVYEFVSNTD